MKTYTFVFALLFISILGCSKDNDSNSDTSGDSGINASYTLLVSENGLIKAQPIDAMESSLKLSSEISPFSNKEYTPLRYMNGEQMSFYESSSNCSGIITKYDFSNNTSKTQNVFDDLGNCNIEVNTIAHNSTSFYIGYSLQTNGVTTYALRVVNVNSGSFEDISLVTKPVQFLISNNQLFSLNIDDSNLDNDLTVFNIVSNVTTFQKKLGMHAKKILFDNENNLIVSYDTMHIEINPTTFALKYFSYSTGLEPKFANSISCNLDNSGKLYYEREPNGNSAFNTIPAIFDFTNNTSYLYIYENFLSDNQINIELEIGETTMVCFDDVNGYMLIGYSKKNNPQKGGIIRVKPVPEPALIDNIDVDGVPFSIFVK